MQHGGVNGLSIKNKIPAIEITKDGGGESEPVPLYVDDDEPEYMADNIDPRRRPMYQNHHYKSNVIGNGGSGGNGGSRGGSPQQVRLCVCVCFV